VASRSDPGSNTQGHGTAEWRRGLLLVVLPAVHFHFMLQLITILNSDEEVPHPRG
jgi:hypothetical protein